jgi:GNAT superfamily N-acetyltransferase
MPRIATPMRAPLVARAEPPLPEGISVRAFTADDVTVVGDLMADAYAGTVDDHGEPRAYHREEARRAVEGEYGPLQWGSSLLAVTLNGAAVAASLVTIHRRRPLLAFALTAPGWRNHGLGTALMVRSANRLAAAGHEEWTLAVTVGNPARRLYERLGFRADGSLWPAASE